MKYLIEKIPVYILVLSVLVTFSCTSNAAELPRDPLAVIGALANSIYVLGEMSGKVEEMVAAEEKAAEEIRQYVAKGSTGGLLEKEYGKQSPLAAAAYMGYPNVVAALLTSDLVRAHINDADSMGMTPWISASFSMRQSLWTCNPAVFGNPYKFVPMVVTQRYYMSNTVAPYRKTREVLEAAGAAPENMRAKEIWLTNCKDASDDTRAKVQVSNDLQKTLQELGAVALTVQLTKLQTKAVK